MFYSCSPGPGGVSPRGRPAAGEKRTPKNSSSPDPGTPNPLNEALSLSLAYSRNKPLKRKVKLSDSYCNWGSELEKGFRVSGSLNPIQSV